MYIYLIDPAGKEYIMYTNNSPVNFTEKYKNFNSTLDKDLNLLFNNNKNYLLMAIESHFINISLFYLKYIF